MKDFLIGGELLHSLGWFLLGLHCDSLIWGITVECTLLVKVRLIFVPNSQSHSLLSLEPPFFSQESGPSPHLACISQVFPIHLHLNVPGVPLLPVPNYSPFQTMFVLAKYWHVVNVACSQTPWQIAEQVF